MIELLPPTRFARFDRKRAALVIAVLLGLTAICLAVIPATVGHFKIPRDPTRTGSDFILYQVEVERLRGGEAYYDVLQSELKARGYSMSSVFNWRTPAHLTSMAMLRSDLAARCVFGALGIVACILIFRVMRREGGVVAAGIAAFLVAFSVLPLVFADWWLFAEQVAGVLIAISAALLVDGKKTGATLFGIAALFIREHAGLFALVSFVLALRRNDRRQAALWIVGFLLYAIYFGMHYFAVRGRLEVAGAGDSSWLCLLGLPLVLNTVRVHPVLMGLPPAVTALCFPVILLGLCATRGAFATLARRVAFLYFCVFAIVGQDVNAYWGWVDAPLVVMGLAFAPAALRDLLRALCRPTAVISSSPVL